jgi:putative FmdB family regulatory protein
MPLFEYECRACGRHFEFLTRDGQSPTCPACESGDLEKLLSVFAVGGPASIGASPRASVGACGSCGHPGGPGSCSLD